jgi:hypothetical protein
MSTNAAPPRPAVVRSPARTVGRWLVSFAGFPLGGLAAMTLVGPVDSVGNAIAGGFLTGLIVGGVQAWSLRADRRAGVAWALATALGLAVGLAVGAVLVGFGTGLAELAVQGLVSGGAVGAAQAGVLVLRGRDPRRGDRGAVSLGHAVAWPVYLAAAWALGWIVTTSIGVRVDEQFTVFGSAGALTVAALTAILPLRLSRGLLDRRAGSTDGSVA